MRRNKRLFGDDMMDLRGSICKEEGMRVQEAGERGFFRTDLQLKLKQRREELVSRGAVKEQMLCVNADSQMEQMKAGKTWA